MGFVLRTLHTGDSVQLTAPYTPLLEQSMFILRRGDSFTTYIQRFLEVVVPVLRSATSTQTPVIVLDELGGIELLSEEFRAVLSHILQHYPVVGTFKMDINATKLQQQTNIDSYRLAKYRQQLLDGFSSCGVCVDTLDHYNGENIKTKLTAVLDGVKENYGKRI